MDACIARGGISHVLSQARASLKNPSRPFTPRTNERPLFHGDDYRPGSRPSSSYSVAEQKQLNSTTSGSVDARKQRVNGSGGGRSGVALPPRPVIKSAELRAPTPSPKVPRNVSVRHEPAVPQGHDSGDDTDPSGDESEVTSPVQESPRSDVHLLETSVEMPSPDALTRTLHDLTQHLGELQHQSPERITSQTIESLVCQLTEFTTSSGAFFPKATSSSRRLSAAHDMSVASKVSGLRCRFFDSLVDLAVGPWHTSAKCVVAIAPCILELFETSFGGDNSLNDEAAAKVVSLGKVLFVLSKETQNDSEFCNVRYVESTLSLMAARTTSSKGMQNACPMKTLIYMAGTLKNVSSGDEKLLKLLATNGAIASLSDSLLWRSKDTAECKEIAQFLVQTTTILRNLSMSKANLKQFNEAQVASRLCEIIECFLPHQELMVNVSRILGKLTLHEAPRAQINQHVERHLGNLLKLVDPHCNSTLAFVSPDEQSSPSQNNQADTKTHDVLLVRIFFVLGNLCASNDRNRQFLGEDAGAVPVLLQSLTYYANKYIRAHQSSHSSEGEGGKLGECGDVLVKLVRLLANLAMNADVGLAINSHRDKMDVLLEVLECAQTSETGDDELILNIVSCITNLSYYCTSSPSSRGSFIEANRLEITTLLSQILWDTSEEAVLEAARAFGNLSRFKDVLRTMGQHKVLDGFVILLDHSNREIVYTVCGVLMNAALDEYARTVLLDVRQVPSGVGDPVVIDARTLLVNILECAALDDVDMSCVAGKVLYNLLLAKKDDGALRYLASEPGQSLQRVVISLLRKMGNPGGSEDDDDDDTSGSQRDLRGVLTQLKTTMARNE